jgi:CRP/FNR family transcriptional regulator
MTMTTVADGFDRCEAAGAFAATRPAGRVAARAKYEGAGVHQHVSLGSFVYHSGDPRRLYRIERGAICHYITWPDGHHEVIEFAFPGDIIGFGTLPEHVSTAQAMVDTVVSEVDDMAVAEFIGRDDRMALRSTSAADREFDFIRQRAISKSRKAPARRVAQYLTALVSIAASEGRASRTIADDMTSGAVADQLNMPIDSLAAALVTLKAHGLIEPASDGLLVVDANELERFAESA